LPAFQGASVLITRRNFGCGSSREHAPWALMDFGFKAIIAPSFADIFYNNCFKNGLLPIVLSEDNVEALFQAVNGKEGYRLTIDLEGQQVIPESGAALPFEIDEFRKHCLLNGLDEIGLTLNEADAIRAYEKGRMEREPWVFADH
jgi:3-isopropylmalate/(R)-2-methylmalate dehydratase small subunit